MIYDFQDLNTKLYITRMVRNWVADPRNAALLLSNPNVKQLTESDLSANSTDDLAWTMLFLIGAGLMRYMVSSFGKKFAIGFNPTWEPPDWLEDRESRANLNAHVDLMLEQERELTGKGVPSTPVVGSLDVIGNRGRRMSRPYPPNRDPDIDRGVIAKRMREYRNKVDFHRPLRR